MAEKMKFQNIIVQATEAQISSFEPGRLYFIRTDEKGKEGYLYLNGRRYGNVDEIREEINEILGILPSGQTISEMFESVQQQIDVLNSDSSVSGSVDYKVAKAISQVISGAPETFDTLKEIADWIEEHGESAATIFQQVIENTEDIKTMKETEEGLKEKDNSLQTQIDALSTILRITGDNVQTITDEEIDKNKIQDVTENGGTAILSTDVTYDNTITIE